MTELQREAWTIGSHRIWSALCDGNRAVLFSGSTLIFMATLLPLDTSRRGLVWVWECPDGINRPPSVLAKHLVYLMTQAETPRLTIERVVTLLETPAPPFNFTESK